MSASPPGLSLLKCAVQEYEWGTIGPESRVARYASATKENEFTAKAEQAYAELWMGSAHPNGPSQVINADGSLTPLKDYIIKHSTQIYGKALARLTKTAQKDGQVPFLFKTLCAGKALPLQIHPDKKLAEKLRQKWPEDLPDDNHKPEIALALTDFQAFASLRPFEQIKSSVERIPELKEILGETADKLLKESPSEELIREAVAQILEERRADPEGTSKLVKQLSDRCQSEGDKAIKAEAGSADEGLASTFVLLNEDYAGDAGAFICAFFMNLFKLKAGECIYVPADGLHAWFRGDIIECMANSDNVLNSAFTDVDKETLEVFNKNVLCPTDTPASHWMVKTERFDRGRRTVRYVTPFSEFDILYTKLETGESEIQQGISGPSVAVVASGSGTLRAGDAELEVKEGQVFLILADEKLGMKTRTGMQVYRCFAE